MDCHVTKRNLKLYCFAHSDVKDQCYWQLERELALLGQKDQTMAENASYIASCDKLFPNQPL